MKKKLFTLLILIIVSICYANNNLEQTRALTLLNNPPLVIYARAGETTIVSVFMCRDGSGSMADGGRIRLVPNPEWNGNPTIVALVNNGDAPVYIDRFIVPEGITLETRGLIIFRRSSLKAPSIIISPSSLPPRKDDDDQTDLGNGNTFGSEKSLRTILHLPSRAKIIRANDDDAPKISCDGCIFHNVSLEQDNNITQCDPKVVGYCKLLK